MMADADMIKTGEEAREFLKGFYIRLLINCSEFGNTITECKEVTEASEVFAADPKMMSQGKDILKELKALETRMNNIIARAGKVKMKTTKNLSSDLREWKERIAYFINFFRKATKD